MCVLSHVVLEAFALTDGFLLADIADEQAIQKCPAQAFFGIADGFGFRHFQRTGRRAVFGDEADQCHRGRCHAQ